MAGANQHGEENTVACSDDNVQSPSDRLSGPSNCSMETPDCPVKHPSLLPNRDPACGPSVHLAHLDGLRLYNAFTAYALSFPPLQKALSVIDSAVRLYTPANLAVAFNGGKDATVVLHIARAAVANWCQQNAQPSRLHCLYLLGAPGEQFPEVTDFARRQITECHLAGVEVELGIKEGIQQFVKHRTSVCAFVMGTRHADPYCASMEHFEPSSEGWPPFMRVNPIVAWEYHHVWEFLRRFELPYCSLYNKGYTSIGSVATTKPNPALENVRDGVTKYRPPWALTDGSLERAGRRKKPHVP